MFSAHFIQLYTFQSMKGFAAITTTITSTQLSKLWAYTMCKKKMNRHLICYILHIIPQTNKIFSEYNLYVCLSSIAPNDWITTWIMDMDWCWEGVLPFHLENVCHHPPSTISINITIISTYDFEWWMLSTWICIIWLSLIGREMKKKWVHNWWRKCTKDTPTYRM